MKKHLLLLSFIFILGSQAYAALEWRCLSDEFHGSIGIDEKMESGFVYEMNPEKPGEEIRTPLEKVHATRPQEGSSRVDIHFKSKRGDAKGSLFTRNRSGSISMRAKRSRSIFVCELVPLPVIDLNEKDPLLLHELPERK